MKLSTPGLLCVGSFLITASISSLLLVCSGFLLLHWVGRLYFSRNLSISSRFQISWYIVLHSNFLQSFVFCGISNLSSFISDCVYLGPLSFFSWWACLKTCRFSLCFQRTRSWVYRSWELCFSSVCHLILLWYGYFLPSTCSGLSLLLFLEFL